MSARRFSFPSVFRGLSSVYDFCFKAREVMEIREGARGDVYSNSVLVQDLKDWGFPTGHFDCHDMLFIPACAMCMEGTNDPTLVKFRDDGKSTGVWGLSFSELTDQELFFAKALPYGYRPNTDIIPVAIWSPMNTDTGTVVWGLEYSWANVGQAFPVTQLFTTESCGRGTTYEHLQGRFAPLYGGGKEAASVIQGRIYRNCVAADTYNTGAVLHGVGLVHARNSIGGRQSYAK